VLPCVHHTCSQKQVSFRDLDKGETFLKLSAVDRQQARAERHYSRLFAVDRLPHQTALRGQII